MFCHYVGCADIIPPVVLLHQDDGEHGHNEGPADGSGYLLGTLDIQTDMTAVVPDGYNLFDPGLLLYNMIFRTFSSRGIPRKKSMIDPVLLVSILCTNRIIQYAHIIHTIQCIQYTYIAMCSV